MDTLAAEAFLNTRHVILGRVMRPLSLGHSFALETFSSPFYAGDRASEAELRMAVWLCSRPALALPETGSLAFRWWSFRTARWSWQKALVQWRDYVDDYLAPPQLWHAVPKAGEEPVEPSRIPPAIKTVVRLMRLGMSAAEAWNTPVGVANWYETAAWEVETGGRVDLVTDSEREAIARQKAREAADVR